MEKKVKKEITSTIILTLYDDLIETLHNPCVCNSNSWMDCVVWFEQKTFLLSIHRYGLCSTQKRLFKVVI